MKFNFLNADVRLDCDRDRDRDSDRDRDRDRDRDPRLDRELRLLKVKFWIESFCF